MKIKWDRRHKKITDLPAESTDLPIDYLRMVEETLTAALEPGLKQLKKMLPVSEFRANGAIYPDEVLLTITLFHGASNLAATTVYASADFTPMAEAPGIEAILGACLDGAGTVFHHYLDPESPEKIAHIADPSLSAMEDGPFEWTRAGAGMESLKTWVKADKFNPLLDDMTERWLKENDPEYQKLVAAESAPHAAEAEEFLEERLEAIQKAKSGSGGSQGGSGPITH